jgi:hypothetical protein
MWMLAGCMRRVMYCTNEENADDHGARSRGQRGTTLVIPPRSDGRAFGSVANLNPR